METIRLIVTDLDGTYLNSYHELNEENIRAVKVARDHGIIVCPVTARNFDCARYTITMSNFDPLCVTNNGASIVDSRDGSHKFENLIDPASARVIIEAAVEAQASVEMFATEFCALYGPTARAFRPDWQERWNEKPEPLRQHLRIYDDLEQMIRDVEHCAQNITLHGKDYQELPGWFYRRVIEQGEFYLTSSHLHCIDIMAYGSTKWQGTQELARILDIPRENIMAFGDNSNDIGMIKWAGVGVAMGNAPQFVQRVADIIAPPNTEAGFAQVVYDLIKRQGDIR